MRSEFPSESVLRTLNLVGKLAGATFSFRPLQPPSRRAPLPPETPAPPHLGPTLASLFSTTRLTRPLDKLVHRRTGGRCRSLLFSPPAITNQWPRSK
jgi:hypothetical protein